MDFGPQQAAALSKMYEAINPALASGLTNARMSMTGNAVKGLRDWSTMGYQWVKPPDKQPSYGRMAAAGGLGSLSSLMGGLKTGGGPSAGGTKYPGAPYTPQYTSSAASNAYADVMGKMAPNVTPSMYPFPFQR